MSSKIHFPCGVCKKNVVINAIECSLCLQWVHLKCGNLKKSDLVRLEGDIVWQCRNCVALFPFNNVEYDELLYWCNNTLPDVKIHENCSSLIAKCQEFNSAVGLM